MNLSVELEKINQDKIKYDLYESYNDPLLCDDQLIESLQDLNEIQKSLSSLVSSQQEKIDTIEENITKSEIQTREGLKDLLEADKLFFSYKPILVGGALGALVGGPVGAAIGMKWAGISTGVGTLLGSYSGYKIQKH